MARLLTGGGASPHTAAMDEAEIQALCERGQRELMDTNYLQAVDTLVNAEEAAWEARAFDTLARLYLPLQEARRQVRQRCGEGAVQLCHCSLAADQPLEPVELIASVPHGQLLIAGFGTLSPAIEFRRLARQRGLYVETFLGATFSDVEGGALVLVVPLEDSPLPSNELRSRDELRKLRPPAHSLLIPRNELPPTVASGTAESYAMVMSLWERLHLPFLQAADGETDPLNKMEAYRLTLRVDPACELAHQHLADVARRLARDA